MAAAAAVKRAIAEQYPVETKQNAENYLIERNDEGTQISPSARAIQSIRFHTNDRLQLVQVRAFPKDGLFKPYKGETSGFRRNPAQPGAARRNPRACASRQCTTSN